MTNRQDVYDTMEEKLQPNIPSQSTPPAPFTPTKPTRLSVNISRDTLDALHEIAGEKGITITEALRRLVGYGVIVYRANRDNHDVLLRRDNKTERIVVLD